MSMKRGGRAKPYADHRHPSPSSSRSSHRRYGRECRTQSHNIPHCEKYNHVCPNTGKPPGYHDPAHAAAAAGEGQEDAADGDAAAAAAAAAAEEEDDSDDDDDIQEVDHPIGHQHPLLQPPVQLGAAPHPPGQVWIEIEDDDE